MPVRSLTSPVLVWPDAASVIASLHDWARQVVASQPGVLRIGYFGSYARGDAGVGSDLDLLLVVRCADVRPERRRQGWRTERLSVPVDLLVYTEEEFERVRSSGKFADVIAQETVWVYRGGQPTVASASVASS